jgi:hypothetical protein
MSAKLTTIFKAILSAKLESYLHAIEHPFWAANLSTIFKAILSA